MLQNSICDSERSEIPKDFFGKLREGPCAAGGKRPAAQGRPRRLAYPTERKPREGQRGKGGRFRYPRGPASWPARVPTLGCPSPYICLQKRIPDMFFQKISKKFFDRCAINIITKHTSHSECRKTARNAEATILGVLFNIRYGLGLYPDDPILRRRKRQLQCGHALILEHHGKLFQRQLYMRVLFKDLRQEETAGQSHRRSR